MIGSTLFYGGVLAVIVGVGLTIGAWVWPVREMRVAQVTSRLDEVAPVWHFREFHSRHIAAPPEEVYPALWRVRADDILFFRTLTWIRRGGRRLPESILNAGTERSIIDVALNGGFVLLADEFPRELVVGAIVDAPPGALRPKTPEILREPPDGYSVAVMNFRLVADGRGGTFLSTETRVFSNGRRTARRFARYWNVIYPGSALIRRMWLRAVEQVTRRKTQGRHRVA